MVHLALQFLKAVDIYPIPASTHITNKHKQTSHCGGILTLLTYLLLLLLISLKTYSILEANSNDIGEPQRRGLLAEDGHLRVL